MIDDIAKGLRVGATERQMPFSGAPPIARSTSALQLMGGDLPRPEERPSFR